tara:strand:+ start:2359 stop:4134 length:1776 start_codon:yes stop_codon:yes gene_type:complete
MNTIASLPQDISANCGHFTAKSVNSASRYNNSVLNVVRDFTNKLPLITNESFLARKSQLHKIITNDSGSPDYLAINIYYDTLRSWYAPNKMQKEDGTTINVKKLKTKGIHLSYQKLSSSYNCSTETIRRKLVKLEKLGLIQRSFRHKETVTTKSYNQLVIYVWRHTPHFFNKHGIDQAEVGVLKPQTNHEYISEKYNIDYHAQIEQLKAIESRGGIHKLVDTKELIEPFNKLKDRSNESNFCKNKFNSKNSNTEPDTKTENFIEDDINNTLGNSIADNSVSSNTTKLQENITASSISKNGFLGNGKNLKDLLGHLTDEMCSTIRSNCGRDFTDKAIREIAKVVSKSKKGAKAFFYHIKGFVSYLSKILIFEKRDSVKTSDTNYYITANQTNEEREERKQEEYLTDVEYSLQVSPEWHLKKKLASVLERSKAYNLLTSYKSLDIKENRAMIHLRKNVELSSMDKEIIMQQIQATHEKIDDQGNYLLIDFLELEIPKKVTSFTKRNSLEKNYPERHGIWGKIRKTFASYFEENGEAIDNSWLSKINAKIDSEQKTIELRAPSVFIKDWIENNYLRYIEDAAKINGLKLLGISG